MGFRFHIGWHEGSIYVEICSGTFHRARNQGSAHRMMGIYSLKELPSATLKLGTDSTSKL